MYKSEVDKDKTQGKGVYTRTCAQLTTPLRKLEWMLSESVRRCSMGAGCEVFSDLLGYALCRERNTATCEVTTTYRQVCCKH
jgi:hypothetical protein